VVLSLLKSTPSALLKALLPGSTVIAVIAQEDKSPEIQCPNARHRQDQERDKRNDRVPSFEPHRIP